MTNSAIDKELIGILKDFVDVVHEFLEVERVSEYRGTGDKTWPRMDQALSDISTRLEKIG